MTVVLRPRTLREGVTVLQILAVAGAYYVAAQPALLQTLGATGEVRLLTPAAGAALAALLLLGRRIWPGIALGSFTVTYTVIPAPLAAAGIAIGTTAGVLLAHTLLRRAGFRNELDRVRDALALVFFGAIVGMMVGAVLRTLVLVSAGDTPVDDFWYRAVLGWMSSAMGVLVVTPFALVLRHLRRPRRLRQARVAEAIALLVATIGVTFLATTSPGGQLLFLVFPLVIWAAWRFQLVGAAPCTLVIAAIVVYAALQRFGPFAETELRSTLLTVHAFIGSTSLAALFLAVAVTERNQARSEIEAAAEQLVGAVNRLDRSLRPRTVPLIAAGTAPGGAEPADRNGSGDLSS